MGQSGQRSDQKGNSRIKHFVLNLPQLRLDFDTFMISGPSTDTSDNVLLLGGVVADAASGKANSLASNCLTDTFQVGEETRRESNEFVLKANLNSR